MIRILCTGDSHTWGQGASGLMETFDPPAEAGERRLAGFAPGSYVNRLRRRAEQLTGASSREWSAAELAKAGSLPFCAPFALLTGRLTLPFSGALLRLEYACSADPAAFTAAVDGVPVGGGELPAQTRPIDCRLLTVPLSEGAHTLTLSVTRGVLPLFRLETYAGAVAVVNSGIGSCPCFRYRENHWDEMVAAVRPDVVLAEAHTINDWIAGDPPDVYEARLTALLRDYAGLGAAVTLMTVSPIIGDQRWQGGALYADYTAAARRAAKAAGAVLCDANAVMTERLSCLSEAEKAEFLFDDPWHPNDRGHALYAELLTDSLIQQGILPESPDKSFAGA